MSTFSIDEIKAIDAAGNKVGQAVWMAKYNPSDGPIPNEGDTEKIRAHVKDKYARPNKKPRQRCSLLALASHMRSLQPSAVHRSPSRTSHSPGNAPFPTAAEARHPPSTLPTQVPKEALV